jgi:hypothetical protein
MKLVCRDRKYEKTVSDRSLTQCPQCNSSNIKIFLFGSAGRGVGKSSGSGFLCECLCELLIPVIFFIILFLIFIGSV